MAVNSTFTPKASLTDAPTNLKEAIDWVLRVTGRDGKKNGECICGLAAAVTDLLQSVELQYHGYQGDSNGGDGKGPQKTRVTECLNGLFSLVQGLGGTAVVRTYIDQLAQVLSALVGWSKIEKCYNSGGKCDHGKNGSDCKYLEDKTPKNKCADCECMKWDVDDADDESKGHHLGRGCTRCKDSSGQPPCKCSGTCSPGKECKCAKAGRCCKCCCKGKCNKCSDKCSCDGYKSAYPKTTREWVEGGFTITWAQLGDTTFDNDGAVNPSQRRHQCARILLGSVCLIWTGITYMYWTGKYAETSPRWNNHILDGSGLDDGTLSQWLQALGFPKDMLNNSGPKNRLDKVIWDGFKEKFYLGFPDTSNGGAHGYDNEGNTFRDPSSMNFAGYIHTLEKGAFGDSVFPNGTTSGTSGSVPDRNKLGPLYKLYILSCAYFTGLQKKNAESATASTNNTTPRTIREILYWLSALPYSQAYKGLLDHCNGALEKASPTEKKLSFLQENRWAPITVHEYNLFAHFQAVTQYCPLVLIGIQGGIHSTNSTTSAIHSLYANTECSFTYPTVSIQAYNQVVHYIRALFYQLYFLRKQCAVKVTCGGKWRECRYGQGVLGKDVVSWMCLGCNPMEHDRKKRVDKVKEGLVGVKERLEKEWKGNKDVIEKLRDILVSIGDVVVQLGNAQERLDRGKDDLDGVKEALKKVFTGGNGGNGFKEVLQEVLVELEKKVEELETEVNGLDKVKEAATKAKTALTAAKGIVDNQNGDDVDPYKNLVSAAIDGIHKALHALKVGWNNTSAIGCRQNIKEAILNAFENMEDICSTSKCPSCQSHSNKCGQKPVPTTCNTCHQQYMDGFPSPLQAFLEDRLPGFSCQEILYTEDADKYPPAASHLGHCGGSGQCCPLPMGFRNKFQEGVTHTGQRLYGILYFFSSENMMQSCVYTLVRVTAELSATTPQVLGDVFGFFRGGVGNPVDGKGEQKSKTCNHDKDPSKEKDKYFCGWCASGLREEVKGIQWIPKTGDAPYRDKVGTALIDIKGDSSASTISLKSTATTTTPSNLSTLTDSNHYVSPLTGELYTAVSATFGGTYLSWVLYLSDALHSGLESLSEAFRNIECRGCKGQCDPNKCKKGAHGQKSDTGSAGLCQCQSIVSCTGVLPVLYRHGFGYGNPFNLEGYEQKDGKTDGDYSIDNKQNPRRCHQFLESLNQVIQKNKQDQDKHPLTNLLKQVGQLQYDIRLPWIFVLTLAWLVAVLYLAFGAIWPLDWTHMRSHWLRGGEHQWQCMWYKVMTGRKGMALVEYFGRK